jgi:putative endonuclease
MATCTLGYGDRSSSRRVASGGAGRSIAVQSTVESGASAEERAARFLARAGLRIVERNFECHQGELDIVAQEGDTLVFVEVRSRATADYGHAAEMVTPKKQRRVSRVAEAYLALRRPVFESARFDVVAITGGSIEHFRDAWRL